jgi:hypothetical protein
MREGMMRTIIFIWEWLVIDLEMLYLSILRGRLSLQTQPIPILN